MIEVLKTLLLAAVGIILAFASVFGLSSERAVAPTEPVPAIIEADEEAVATSTPDAVATPTATTTARQPAPAPKPKPIPKEPEPAPIEEVIETITAPIEPPAAPATLNEKVRAAVVNIICTTDAGGYFNSISASGVVIDPRGIVLTNSHVAQYFLLRDYPFPGFVDCIVRTGSPAYPRYTAELLFMPPSWIQKNGHKITHENPTGNGEHDYALVRITGTINPDASLPSAFPHLPIATREPRQGETSLIAGYPAGFLGGITIAKDLYQASSAALVRELYTFDVSTPDLFSIGGSVVAQQGSSGGAAADDAGELLGLIVTSTDAADTASRDLRAIAASYILRDFEKESGSSLSSFLAGDVAREAELFALGVMPTLRQTLINALEGNN